MNLEKFTDRSRGFLQEAEKLAGKMNHQFITPEHLLKCMLEDSDGMAANLLRQSGANVNAVMQKVEAELNKLPSVEGQGVQLSASQSFVKALAQAEEIAQKAKDAYVSVERLLQALL